MLTVRPAGPPRIACVYGEAFAPFLGDVLTDLGAGVLKSGGEFLPQTADDAWRRRALAPQVDAVYILPFDSPQHLGAPADAEEFIAAAFHGAPPVVPFAVQELCWDKIATQERLLKQGVPTPTALVTDDFAEVRKFVREHRFAMLKEPRSCGGAGHFVLWIEDGAVVADCGSHLYRLEPRRGGRIELDGDRLYYPAPFYLQRLVGQHAKHDMLPAQVLRAFVVEREIYFWAERFREHYERPSDWIVNASRGARYRLLHAGSHEAQKVALRAAEALGMHTGVIDIVRAPNGPPLVIEADVDSHHMYIDRSFKQLPEFRDFFDFDRYVSRSLVRRLQAPPPEPERTKPAPRTTRPSAPRPTPPRPASPPPPSPWPRKRF